MKTIQQEISDVFYIGDKLISRRCNEAYATKHNVWDKIVEYSDFDVINFHTITDIILAIRRGVALAPRCPCGKFTKRSTDLGKQGTWRPYCGTKCMGKYDDFTSRRSKVDESLASQKRKETMIQKYGVTTNSQRPEIKKLLKQHMKARLPPEARVKMDDRDWLHHQYVTLMRPSTSIAKELNIFYGTVLDYCRSYGFEIRHRYNRSEAEKEVESFVKSLGVNVTVGDRSIIGYELDLVCRDFGIAIEYNGLYWHSSPEKSGMKYHLTKTELVEDVGMQLLHIYSDEWECPIKQDIWKSIITHKLKLTPIKIAARRCDLVTLDSKAARNFYETNHLHGFVGGIHLGLEYDGEIVAAVTYGKSRFDNSGEILRICCKKFTHVQGGLSKLLSVIPKGTYTTYGDRSFSTLSSYGSLFDFVKYTQPNYFYIPVGAMYRVSRYAAQKHKLQDLLGDGYNPNETEMVNMINAGYRVLYNSGNVKFLYTRQ